MVAISQVSIFNQDVFEAEVSAAMTQGKITSLVKPGEDTWYMKQYPENWAGYENYAYWLKISVSEDAYADSQSTPTTKCFRS